MMTDTDLGKRLNRYFSQKVQLRSEEKRKAKKVWGPVVKTILDYVKEADSRFDFNVVYSGSYYERTKTKEPNEFDLMLEMRSLKFSHTEEVSVSNSITRPPLGFTLLQLNQNSKENFKTCIEHGNRLSATALKKEFADLVHDAIKLNNNVSARITGPSVKLSINYPRFKGSIDLTLAFECGTLPEDVEDWQRRQRGGWPSQDLVEEIVQEGCHFVAKKPKESTNRYADLFWRYSFSRAEKKLFTFGSPGEAGTCRRMVLRIIKSLREDLHLTPLTSYHLKSIMLYEYEAYPQDFHWGNDKIAARFTSALQRLLNCLRKRNCRHYFISSINLFDSNSFNNDRYEFLITNVMGLLNEPNRYIRLPR